MRSRSLHLFYPVLVVAMLLSVQQSSFAQARLVIANAQAVYMRMSGGNSTTPIYLVLDNPAANAITCGAAGAVCPASGSLSWIISEGQYHFVKWRQVAATTCVVPFGSVVASNAYLPLTFAKTTAGAADLTLSTWPSASNNTPWAGISDDIFGTPVAAVTQMYSSAIGQDASDEAVIDRWWDMYTGGVATTANVTFNYRGAENTMTSSPTGPIAAQHWTGTNWNDGKGGGDGTMTSTGSNGVTSGIGTATASGLTQFTPFILVSEAAPLPVTWLDVSAECNSGDITIKWSTASEQNADYFTVERSTDGTNFTDLANVLASGNSSTVKNYSYVDTEPYDGVSFYRIRETDFNSSTMYSTLLTVNSCANDDIFIYGSEGGISVNIEAGAEGRYNFELYDVLGRNVLKETRTVSAGSNHLKIAVSNIASAMYVAKVYSTSNAVSKKVFIRSAYTQ